LTRLGDGLPGNSVKGSKIVYRWEKMAEDPNNLIFAIFELGDLT
jgi:hypothetical protein